MINIMSLKMCEVVLVIVLFSTVQLVDKTNSQQFVAENCDKNLFRRLSLTERMLEFENYSDVMQIFAVKQRTSPQRATVKIKEFDDPKICSQLTDETENSDPWPLVIKYLNIVFFCSLFGMISTFYYQILKVRKAFLQDEMLYEEMEHKKSGSLENLRNIQAQRELAEERKRKKEEADALQRRLDARNPFWTVHEVKEHWYKSITRTPGSSTYDPYSRRSSFPPDYANTPNRYGQYGTQYGAQSYNNQVDRYGLPINGGQMYNNNGAYGGSKYGMGSNSYPEINHHPRRVRMLRRR